VGCTSDTDDEGPEVGRVFAGKEALGGLVGAIQSVGEGGLL
jgi:hypothetical protein